MPAVQLTKPITQIATVSYTFPAAAAINVVNAASITNPRFVSLASSSTQFVPTAEYWYITGYFLNTGQSASICSALLVTYVNGAVQPLTISETEILQSTYNKLTFPASEWVQLPNGQQWQQGMVSTVINTTTTTTVTIQETILRMPLAMLQ